MIWLAYIAFAIVNAAWLRHHVAFLQRLNDVHWSAIMLFDIVGGFVVFSLIWLLGVLDVRPEQGETISRFLGRHAGEGKRWAIWLAAFVDFLFRTLTGQRDHCANAAASSLVAR